jgi:single-strand DNA-binding protein
MADINRAILVGRLTRDAELKYTSGGTAVSRFGLAINRRRKVGDQWEDEPNFFDIVVWGRTAESLNQYLVKGKQIGVDGELRQNRWEQDGQKRSRVEIHANNIQLLGSRGDSGGGAPRSQGAASQGAASQGEGGSSYTDDFEDDIPF